MVDGAGAPGGLDGARVLTGVWALAANQPRTLFAIAHELRMPLTRVEAACKALNEAGAMAAKRGQDGAMNYNLTMPGMHAGHALAKEWLAIMREAPAGHLNLVALAPTDEVASPLVVTNQCLRAARAARGLYPRPLRLCHTPVRK